MKLKSRKILGFSDSKSVFVSENEQAHYFELMLKLADVDNPKLTYIGAAKAEDPQRIAHVLEMSNRYACKTEIFRLYDMKSDNPDEYFQGSDIIFIDGGVTRNLRALFLEWDVVQPLLRAYESGTLLAGASAGISLLFDWCVTDSIKSNIKPMRGIGILKGSVCAHYDANENRRSVFAHLVNEETSARPAFGLCEGSAALFENETFVSGYSLGQGCNIFEFKDGKSRIDHMMIDVTTNYVPEVKSNQR